MSSTYTLAEVILRACSHRAVVAAMRSSWALVTLGSPTPWTMTRFVAAPLRTRVVKRLSGPIRLRAFDAVTSLLVEAGL